MRSAWAVSAAWVLTRSECLAISMAAVLNLGLDPSGGRTSDNHILIHNGREITVMKKQ